VSFAFQIPAFPESAVCREELLTGKNNIMADKKPKNIFVTDLNERALYETFAKRI
jgi:hypothetical protein